MRSYSGLIAIILAAGAGHRAGGPKWRLKHEDKSFLEIILDKLGTAGIRDIYCVVRKDSVPPLGLHYIINPAPENGMISSIHQAFREASSSDFYLVIPVDHPFISSETIKKLCTHANIRGQNIIRPVFNGKGGHPIIIPRRIASAVPQSYEGGLKQFFIDNKYPCTDVEVKDPGILKNINTVEDLTREC